MIVAVIVMVIVVVPLIVAALVNGNDTVCVIHAVLLALPRKARAMSEHAPRGTAPR